eukprot:4637017-Pleurochrysis_carterae.AAC.1
MDNCQVRLTCVTKPCCSALAQATVSVVVARCWRHGVCDAGSLRVSEITHTLLVKEWTYGVVC